VGLKPYQYASKLAELSSLPHVLVLKKRQIMRKLQQIDVISFTFLRYSLVVVARQHFFVSNLALAEVKQYSRHELSCMNYE
jgi:hypothetical protein